MVAIQTNMGLLPQCFFPQQAGRDYRPSPYLELLGELRRDFTVFSGLSHVGMTGGHAADKSFLTAALDPGSGTFRNTISLDQWAAERLDPPTRWKSLVLSCCNGGDRSLSFTPSGEMIPPLPSPAGFDFIDRLRRTYEFIRLALATDATRIVTLFVQPLGTLSTVAGVSHDTHCLTHHADRPAAIAELRKIEEAQLLALRDFLTSLRNVAVQGETLLDRTMVLYGSALGDANSHGTSNLPILLAGGGFRHGQHLVFDRRPTYNEPLSNLFVSMLQRLGLETDRFAASTGPLGGLETA